jgi:hypothetical protein
MKNTTIFTPFASKKSNETINMQISHEDMAKFNALDHTSRKSVEVFDNVTQKTYKVARESCGLACRCAAVVL